MMQILKDIGGVELPDFIAKLTPESRGETNGAAAVGPVQEASGPLPRKG